MVFQSFNLWQHRTLIQNVTEVPIHVLNVPKDDLDSLVQEALDDPSTAGNPVPLTRDTTRALLEDCF